MPKVFIVLDEKEQVEMERIHIDKDPEEALDFVLNVIAPQVRKKVPCSDKALEIYRTERRF